MAIKNHDTLRQWMEQVYQRTGFWPTSTEVFDYAHEELKPLKQRVAELEKDCEILQTNLDAALQQAEQAPAVDAVPVAWKHDCAALLTNNVELWIDACPHCGKPRAPARKPLTDEQILKAISPELWMHIEGTEREMRLRDARAIEAAHDIAKETGDKT